jgi:hypothetical protein
MRREAATFLRIVAPFDAQLLKSNLSDAPTTTSGLQAYLAPLAKVASNLVSAILDAGFSGPAAAPARTMAIAAEAVAADIQSVTASNWASGKSLIAHDEGTVSQEARNVRADLGLHATT